MSAQLDLLGGVDETVRKAYRGADDRAWERSRKLRRKGSPPPVPDGPCCATCRRWTPGEPYGACGVLAVHRPGKGATVMTAAQAEREGGPWDSLRTAPGYAACGLHREREER